VHTEYADLLFNMALLNSGFNVENPGDLTEPLERLIKVVFGLERDAECEDIEVNIDDSESEEGSEEETETESDSDEQEV